MVCCRQILRSWERVGASLATKHFGRRWRVRQTGLRAFHTRNEFDEGVSDDLLARFFFESANIDVESFTALKKTVQALDKKYQAGGNILFYFAMAPRFFGALCENLV